MSDPIIPFVIHWDGEPEPNLTGIDDPVRVPFRFEPFQAKGRVLSNRARYEPEHPIWPAQVSQEAASRPQLAAENGPATSVILPDGTHVIDPATGRDLVKPGFVNLERNVLTGLALQELAVIAPATREVVFFFLFRQGGLMDYQRSGEYGLIPYEGKYRDFGNYNFGMVGAAAGYSLSLLLVSAGRYNQSVNAKPSDNSLGLSDRNEEWIRAGYADFQAHVLGHL